MYASYTGIRMRIYDTYDRDYLRTINTIHQCMTIWQFSGKTAKVTSGPYIVHTYAMKCLTPKRRMYRGGRSPTGRVAGSSTGASAVVFD